MGNIIGTRVQRIDGRQKVTGRAIYGDDILLPHMLHAACRYTDIPCGRIKRVDFREALSVKGLKAIITYTDIPGKKRIGPIREDHLPLVESEIFYIGDVIAAVAADSREAAWEACEKIKVDYETIPGVFDIQSALLPGSRLIHPEYKSNIVVHYPLIKGDVKLGFAQSEKVITRQYRTGFVEHAYIEPESITAELDESGLGFIIRGSIQNPFTTRRMVASFMGVDLNRVNVLSSTLGGSFGGKDDIINMMACRVALLCRKTQRPVKLTNSREISMRESYKRHPYIMKYKVGFNNDGRIIAMQIEILADSGAYSSQSFFVTWRSVVQATGPYTIPHVRTDIRAVYTNNSYTAAFRGFGSPQIIFAQESLMDEIAALCNISPLQIRKINGLKNGSITATGQKLSGHAVSLRQVITQAAGEADYSLKVKKYQKLNSNNGRYRYGIGLACSLRGCSLGAEGTDASSAIVSVQADGSVYLLTALNENGQGLRTTFSMIVAEVLGISLYRIVFVEPATAAIADGGPTVASRSTLMGGNAVMDAALQVKKAIFQAIRPELKVRKLSETCWKDDKIIKITAGEKSESAINFETAVSRAIRAGTNLSAYGWYHAPAVDWEESSGQGKAYFTYVYGCQVAETILDTSTGKLEIIRITAAHDAGTIINRSGAEGQVYGGVVQGLGYGIMEDFSLIEGRLATANFDEYLIPTIKDVPTIKPVFVENPDKNGPYGAKSLGEPTLELTAAAINNALAFATGKRSYEIPLSLEQVYLGSNLQKPSRQSESRNIRTSKQILPYLPGVDIITPSGIDKAFQMLATGGFQILAGGTDLIIQARKVTPARKLLNLGSIKELQFIKEEPGSVHIGAMTTFTQILENPLLRRYYPVLLEAVRKIGSQQIRNRATIGGNIVNAAPCADSLPPLLIYNSRLKLQSLQGIRMVPVVDFTLDAYETMIRKDEILIAIEIPKPADHYFHSYFQLGRRNAVNITRMSVAGVMSFRSDKKVRDCRLACGSVFSRPCRLERVENAMIGNILSTDKISQLEQTLKSDTEAEIGSRWSSPYKIPVFANMVRDVFMDMLSQFKDQQCY